MDLVTSVAGKNPGRNLHGNGHGHVQVYARLGHIKRTMQEPEFPSDWPSMRQVVRLQLQCSAAALTLV